MALAEIVRQSYVLRTMSLFRPDASIGFLTTDVSRLIRRAFERELAASDLPLTVGQARTLAYVVAHAGRRQSALAERMGIEPMTLVNFLDQLEQLGLVERRPHPSDRRAKTVHTTPAAEPLLAALDAIAGRVRARVVAGLTPRQVDALIHTLEHIRDGLTGGEDAS